jgi:thiamine-phosphate pyrophosphorylase
MKFDVYVVTDETVSGGRSHAEIARQATAGGAGIIQLRDKARSCSELVRIGREIGAITRSAGAGFIVNDRLDVAISCGADGVHLGQGDVSCGVARQIAPPGFVIGVSVGSVAEARDAEREGADYVALSPVFATGSKPDAGPGHGLAIIREIRAAVRIPVIAIGGIGPENAGRVIDAGADGVAVISAITGAPDITGAARQMVTIVAAGKAARKNTGTVTHERP